MFYSKIIARAKQSLGKYESENKSTYAAAEQAIGGLLIIDGVFGTVNPLGGRRRNGIFGSFVGIIIGIVFIFVPTIFNKVSGTFAMTATTNAKVISVTQNQATTTTTANGTTNNSPSCSAVAQYTVNGQQYTNQSSFASSSYCSLAQGQTVAINYNPNKPASWGYNVKAINTVVSIFRWVGVFAVVVSFITFLIRLFCIIFGWKLLMKGRALAKTLPEGTNLESVISEIKQNFSKDLFGFGRGTGSPPAAPGPNQQSS